MTRNTNFDDVRDGFTVAFKIPSKLSGLTPNKAYEVFGFMQEDTFSCFQVDRDDGISSGNITCPHWIAWGGYVISQPDKAPTEQPPARTDTDRLDWAIRKTGIYYGIPGFGPVSGRSVEQRVKDCRAAIDAAMDREARG